MSVVRFATLVLVAAACGEPMGDLQPAERPGGKGDGFCPAVPAGIVADPVPPFSCGPVDPLGAAVMAEVNGFWGSEVGLCSCGPDFPQACDGAYSLFDKGWLYYSPSFLAGLTASGSFAPSFYVLAHEFGHEIEGHFGVLAPTTLARELTADCLAGYFLGSLVCAGRTTARDIETTLATACVIADGTGDPLADLETHGTCRQRVGSVAIGIQAYLAGAPALASCAL
jgi:hypothetical protein